MLLLDLDETLIHSEEYRKGEDYDFVVDFAPRYSKHPDVSLPPNTLPSSWGSSSGHTAWNSSKGWQKSSQSPFSQPPRRTTVTK